MENQTLTKGNVIVENIKVGDIHYEYEMGVGVKSEVMTLPTLDGDMWNWESKNLKTGMIIKYGTLDVHAKDYGMTQQMGLNLYTYEAYEVKRWI